MAMYRYGHAAVVQPSIHADDWTNKVYKHACKDGQCRMKTAKTVIAKYAPDKYMLSHCTIIAAVDVDLANPKDPKSGYLIKPEFSPYVNNNGDAWTKEVLKNSYQSFIGGENYVEHVQIPELSKGKIIDAVLREIPIGKDKENKELTTLYCDILVATDRKHEDTVRKIESKELTSMSMGCLIKYSICSKCGNKAIDETQACDHVRYQKNNMFFDDNGVQRKIGELCLPWNNKVLMSDGSYQYISEVKKNQEVISHRGTPVKVVEVFERVYAGDLFVIKAEGLSKRVESTPDHPHYVYDGKKFIFKKAKDIKIGDFLVKKSVSLENTKNIPEFNEELGWLFGMYVAEGCCYNDTVQFSLNDKDEQELALKISCLLEKYFPPDKNNSFLKEHCDWEQLIEKNNVLPIRESSRRVINEEQKKFICGKCGAPYNYIVFNKKGVTRCKICKHESAFKRTWGPLKRVKVYLYDRNEKQHFIGDRPIKSEGSKKLTVIYRNKACFDFFKKYCKGDRAFLKKPSNDLLFVEPQIQKQILIGWLKGDGSIDLELRLRGYTTSENVFRFMELLATGLNYWTRYQVLFNDELRDLGDLRNIEANLELLLDDKNCHPRFVLYFSPKDCSEIAESCGFIDKYPEKRKETRKVDGYILHKVRSISVEPFLGKIYNLSLEKEHSFIIDGIVTHNCGHKDEPDSVKFIEASWVKQPAFTGAVLRSFVTPSKEIEAKFEKAEKVSPYKFQKGDFLKAATLSDLIAQDKPKKDEPPAEEPPADAPAEPPADETPADEPPADAPAEEPMTDIPAEEPPEEDDIKVWKKDLKKQVLKQITDDVMKDLSEEEESGAPGTETLDETLIRPASLVLNKVWGAQKTWDRFIKQRVGSSLNKASYDKLRYGVHIAMTTNDLSTLKDYGYSKRDFLAVMSFIDSCMKNSLPVSVKRTIASIGGTKGRTPIEVLSIVVENLGRKVTSDEARKVLSWLKLLDYYPEV